VKLCEDFNNYEKVCKKYEKLTLKCGNSMENSKYLWKKYGNDMEV
jgi:hypothetical protein